MFCEFRGFWLFLLLSYFSWTFCEIFFIRALCVWIFCVHWCFFFSLLQLICDRAPASVSPTQTWPPMSMSWILKSDCGYPVTIKFICILIFYGEQVYLARSSSVKWWNRACSVESRRLWIKYILLNKYLYRYRYWMIFFFFKKNFKKKNQLFMVLLKTFFLKRDLKLSQAERVSLKARDDHVFHVHRRWV